MRTTQQDFQLAAMDTATEVVASFSRVTLELHEALRAHPGKTEAMAHFRKIASEQMSRASAFMEATFDHLDKAGALEEPEEEPVKTEPFIH